MSPSTSITLETISMETEAYFGLRATHRRAFEASQGANWNRLAFRQEVGRTYDTLAASRRRLIDLFGEQYLEAIGALYDAARDAVRVCQECDLPIPVHLAELARTITASIPVSATPAAAIPATPTPATPTPICATPDPCP